MSEPVGEEEHGGDPPCWAAQFADDEGEDEDEDEAVSSSGLRSPCS
jgi:hypothetical protein